MNICPTCHRPFAASRSDDPATSEAAGERAVNREGNPLGVRPNTQRAKLLASYSDGVLIADYQAAYRAGLDRPGVCWWKRCSELRQGGFIELAGEVLGPNDAIVMTCRITDEGRRVLAEISPVSDRLF